MQIIIYVGRSAFISTEREARWCFGRTIEEADPFLFGSANTHTLCQSTQKQFITFTNTDKHPFTHRVRERDQGVYHIDEGEQSFSALMNARRVKQVRAPHK